MGIKQNRNTRLKPPLNDELIDFAVSTNKVMPEIAKALLIVAGCYKQGI